MKIAIYTIALNEEKNAKKYMEAHQSADLIVIGDNGSTDATKQIVEDHGGAVVPLRVLPFRFDIARNSLLSVLPEDIDLCLAIDLDETMRPGWRNVIEQHWQPGTHHRMRFRYIHNFLADGTEGGTGVKDFAHQRAQYIWKHMVHEKLYYVGPNEENVLSCTDLVVEHRQSSKQTRSRYTSLMELECSVGQPSHQHVFWLARQYVYEESYNKAVFWLEKFLALCETDEVWIIEEAHANRLLGVCYDKMDEKDKARRYHLKAVALAPGQREVWLGLAYFHAGVEELDLAYYACVNGLKITQRPEHYLTTSEAWGWQMYDMAARCAYALNIPTEAKHYTELALALSPNNAELQDLARYYKIIKTDEE